MSNLVKLALIQQHAVADKGDNLFRSIKAFEYAAMKGAKIIAFPELSFTTFYPQKPAAGNTLELSEPIPGPTTDVFCELAKKWQVVVVLNLFERIGDKTFDSSPVIDTDGTILGITRMVHIIEAPCFFEQGYYTPGDGKNLVFNTTICKIGVCICYDRHFPEYMRILGLMGAELVIIPQAGAKDEWPACLFECEMQVAGFQNGYFTALCNRVGQEEDIYFEGKSFITSPDGKIISQAPKGKDFVLISEINLDEIKNSHAKSHFIADRRPDLYSLWFKKNNKA
jgi:N-carbamoylputrescine amidase